MIRNENARPRRGRLTRAPSRATAIGMSAPSPPLAAPPALTVKDRLSCLLEAVRRGPLRRHPEPGALDLLVVSPGGVATTSLIRHLNDYLRVNWSDDSDGLKHLPRPPAQAPPTLFIHGDPALVRASLSRRGWIDFQAAKLGSPMTVLLHGAARDRAFEGAVARQRRRWEAAPRVLMLGYDEIWDRSAEIADFAGITDPEFLRRFPPRKPRASRQERPG